MRLERTGPSGKLVLQGAEQWVFQIMKAWADGTRPQNALAVGTLGTNLAAMAGFDCRARWVHRECIVLAQFEGAATLDARARVAEVVAAAGGLSSWRMLPKTAAPYVSEVCLMLDPHRERPGKGRR